MNSPDFLWRITALDYLLIFEGLILLVAAIFAGIGEVFGKGNSSDELKRITRRFWRELISPTPAAVPIVALASEEGETDEESTTEMFARSKSKSKPSGEPVTVSSTLSIKVIPGSSRNEVAGRLGDAIKVKVSVPPEGGEANKAVIDLLAEVFGIPAWRIKLIRGHYDSRKVLQISGLSADQVQEKLAPHL